MSAIFWVAVIGIVVGGLIYISVEGDINPVSIAQSDIKKLTKSFETGDSISFFLTPTKTSEFEYGPESPFVNNENEGIVQTDQNQTVQIRNETLIETSQIGGSSSDQIPIGNIIRIAGNIRLVDPNTINPDKPEYVPPPFKYVLEITCDHRQYCNLQPLATRGTTDSIGNFEYKWTTSYRDSLGEYVAKITARSEILDPFDKPYLLEHEYRFSLF